MIVETGQGSVSDETGHFVFKEIPAGDYTLRVQMLGYTTEEIKVTVSNEYATDVHIALIEEGGEQVRSGSIRDRYYRADKHIINSCGLTYDLF